MVNTRKIPGERARERDDNGIGSGGDRERKGEQRLLQSVP